MKIPCRTRTRELIGVFFKTLEEAKRYVKDDQFIILPCHMQKQTVFLVVLAKQLKAFYDAPRP